MKNIKSPFPGESGLGVTEFSENTYFLERDNAIGNTRFSGQFLSRLFEDLL
jgi:hypothetical protein